MSTDHADIEGLFREVLAAPTSSIAYRAGLALRELFPEHGWIEERASAHFDLEAWAAAHPEEATLRRVEEVHAQISTFWNDTDRRLRHEPQNAWFTLQWRDQRHDIVQVSWYENAYGRTTTSFFLLGPDRETVEALSAEVGRWSATLREEILVFEDGCWSKSKRLYREVQQSAGLERLILAPGLEEEIVADVTRFFASEEVYRAQGLPWKRGVLLLGPPGNGKTHMVRALSQVVDVPSLYVRSFKTQYQTDQALMRDVFRRARQVAPCLLVLEDLDNLITEENRSFFLNELDGFAHNRGILAVATTNHPERLDPALLHRPSRFDRKFTFALPDRALRRAYLEAWRQRLPDPQAVDDQRLDGIARVTDDFTFAYLKELTLGATLRCVQDPERSLSEAMGEVLEVLQREMKAVQAGPS